MARIVNKQFNSPIGLYSDQNVKEVLERETQMLSNGAVGVNFYNPNTMVAKPANLQNSAVLRMLEEEESRQRNGQPPSHVADCADPVREAWPVWPPPNHDQKPQRSSFRDVVVPGAKRVTWPPPKEDGNESENVQTQPQGGPQYSSQPASGLQNNHAQSPNYQVHSPSIETCYEPPYQPQSPLPPQQSPQPQQYQPQPQYQQAPASPSIHSPAGHSPTPPFFRSVKPPQSVNRPQQYQPPSPQPQYQPPQQQYQPPSPQPQYQPPQQQYQPPSPQPQYQPPQQQYQPPSLQPQYQPPQQQYQPPQQQYQPPQQQYQPPQQQYQSPQQQYQPPQQQYQPPQQQYQPPQQQYQPPQQQYQPPQQQYQPPQQQYQPPQQQYQASQEQYPASQPQYQQQYNDNQSSQYNQTQYQTTTLQQYQTTSSGQQNQFGSAPSQGYQQPQNNYQEPPPSTITLRPQAPVSQAPAPVYSAQPATATFKGGKHLRGDLKWPPEDVRARMAAENQARIELAKGPACRPRKVHKDYSPFFAKHALSNTYPGYKIPPGTQFYEHMCMH